MFENYNDSQRPNHDVLAAHYGLYFDNLPKRILVMGILANETPTFSAYGARSNIPPLSLIYCPGTEHDPLRHDNESYWSAAQLAEMEEQRRREAEQDKLKTDLILPLEVAVDHSGEKEVLVVTGRNLAGQELCTVRGNLEEKVSWLRWEIKKVVDPEDKHHVVLVRPSGRLIALDQDSLLLRDLRPGSLADVKAAFAKADLNKDGFLDKSEPLDSALTAVAGSPVKEMLKTLAKDLPVMSDGEIDKLFDAVDANADGRLNVTEFIDWCFGVQTMDDAERSDLRPGVVEWGKGQLSRAKASLVKGLPPAKITRTGSS
ncbi:CML1 [Symbiodinium sp. CCMP2456]|nr:CML1 [Symbiodinium sp. CCMP2456]